VTAGVMPMLERLCLFSEPGGGPAEPAAPAPPPPPPAPAAPGGGQSFAQRWGWGAWRGKGGSAAAPEAGVAAAPEGQQQQQREKQQQQQQQQQQRARLEQAEQQPDDRLTQQQPSWQQQAEEAATGTEQPEEQQQGPRPRAGADALGGRSWWSYLPGPSFSAQALSPRAAAGALFRGGGGDGSGGAAADGSGGGPSGLELVAEAEESATPPSFGPEDVALGLHRQAARMLALLCLLPGPAARVAGGRWLEWLRAAAANDDCR
jgi:hypothetical protein